MKKINKLIINTSIIMGGVLLSYKLVKVAYKKMYKNYMKELEDEDFLEDESVTDYLDEEMVDPEIAQEYDNDTCKGFEKRKYITLNNKKRA